MDLGALTATLGCDASGLRSAESQMRTFGASAESTFGRAGDAASSCASQLATIAGVTLSLVGAYELAHKAISSWYSLISGGVSIVDDYQKKIISTSYILTTMSNVPPPDLSQAYGQWKDYFDWMYRESLRVDKMAAASGTEIFSVGIEMAKKGVVATTEEQMNTIGRLTDLMKAVTPSYMNFEQQARGEIQAMMEGTVRMGAQTAQILDQIDPKFKENIKNAREQGKVLEYIESILPQIKQYTLDLMGTWDSVGSSLKSAWSVINLAAFGDAHREVVSLASQLGTHLVDNGKLTADGEKAARALAEAWGSARVKITEAFDYLLNNSEKVISDVGTIASAAGTIAGAFASATTTLAGLITQLSAAANNPFIQMLMGGALGSRFGAVGAAVGALAYPGSKYLASGENVPFVNMTPSGQAPEPESFTGYEVPLLGELYKRPPASPPTPPVRPFAGKPEKGGAGGAGALESAEKAVRSFIETMNQETARGAGETEGILNAWYSKQAQKLDEWVTKGADVTQAKSALDEAYYAKLDKLNDTFNDWYNQGLGNQYEQLVAQERKKLAEVAGNAEKSAQVQEVYDRKHWDLRQQMETEGLNLFKGYLDTMASTSPLLSEQLGYKQQALELELKLADAALKRSFNEGKITQDTYDQARAMQAVTAQAKRYALEREGWQTQGIGGGFNIWATERQGEMQTRGAKQFQSAMKSLETWTSTTIAHGIVSKLKGEKMDLTQVGWDIAEGIINKTVEGFTTQVFDVIATAGLNLVGAGVNTGSMILTGSAQGSGYLNQAGTNIFNLLIQGAQAIANAFSSGGGGGGFGGILGGVLSLGGALLAPFTGGMSLGAAAAAGAGTFSAFNVVGSGAGALFSLIRHEGGMLNPVYAHDGLKPHEVSFIGLDTERVLSPAETRAYNAGERAGGGGKSVVNAPITITINPRHEMSQADYNRHARMITRALNKELGRFGQKIGDGRI